MIAKNLQVMPTAKGVFVSLELANKSDGLILSQLQEVELLDFKIGKHRNRRSLTANSYIWILLDKLAEKLQTTKTELYKHAIKEVGKFEMIPIKSEAVETFISAWEGQGLGNIAERKRESTIDGYEVVQAYYGSSCYDSKEMARLIDYVITECQEQGIETMSTAEIERLGVK